MEDVIKRFSEAEQAGDIKQMSNVFSEFCTKLSLSGEDEKLAAAQAKRIAERHNKIVNPGGPGIRKL